ncbi:hypothetical protein FB107DRAFT_252233 [Schizophyllum commune]
MPHSAYEHRRKSKVVVLLLSRVGAPGVACGSDAEWQQLASWASAQDGNRRFELEEAQVEEAQPERRLRLGEPPAEVEEAPRWVYKKLVDEVLAPPEKGIAVEAEALLRRLGERPAAEAVREAQGWARRRLDVAAESEDVVIVEHTDCGLLVRVFGGLEVGVIEYNRMPSRYARRESRIRERERTAWSQANLRPWGQNETPANGHRDGMYFVKPREWVRKQGNHQREAVKASHVIGWALMEGAQPSALGDCILEVYDETCPKPLMIEVGEAQAIVVKSPADNELGVHDVGPLRPDHKLTPILDEVDQAFDVRIVPHLTSPTQNLPEHTLWSRMMSQLYGYDTRNPAIQLPAYVFSADTTQLGQCWEVGAHVAQIGVRFGHDLRLGAIALYHPGSFFLPDDALSSLPRVVQVWAEIAASAESTVSPSRTALAAQQFVTDGSNRQGTFVLLAELEYSDHPPRATYLVFPLHDLAVNEAEVKAGFRLVLRSAHNWGSNGTCWYRVAIHSREGV